MRARHGLTLGFLGIALILLLAPWAQPQPPVREITRIAGEVYRFRNNILQDLRGEVQRHAREGKSLDEIKRLVTLPKYAAWNPKDWFPLNIEGRYRLVHANRRGN
jgi:hypothetical protein